MGIWELLLTATALSMDAFAVAICKGLSVKKVRLGNSLTVGAYFGGFQALMPLIGFLLGSAFKSLIENIDHWIAFGLLGLIGANMIREALSGDDEEVDCSFCAKSMFPLAVATSIDALAVGVGFAVINVQILPAVTCIGVITFVLSATGVYIGNYFGAKYKSKAEMLGGIVLILMGLKILLEHLGVL